MPDLSPAEAFLDLSKRLKATGQLELRKELNKAVRDAAKPLIAKTREAARRELPKRGGLAARYARQPQRVRTRTGVKEAGVSIVFSGQPGITTGQIRHPVFGTGRFVTQQVNATWWDDTLADSAPVVRDEIVAAIGRVAAKMTDG